MRVLNTGAVRYGNFRFHYLSLRFVALTCATLDRFHLSFGWFRRRGTIARLCANILQVFVLDDHELVLANFVAARLVGRPDGLARNPVEELLAQRIACSPVYLAEGDALAGIDSRVEGDGTRDQRQLEVPLPVGPGGHKKLHAAQGQHPRWLLVCNLFSGRRAKN